jgi:hypothetical protein
MHKKLHIVSALLSIDPSNSLSRCLGIFLNLGPLATSPLFSKLFSWKRALPKAAHAVPRMSCWLGSIALALKTPHDPFSLEPISKDGVSDSVGQGRVLQVDVSPSLYSVRSVLGVGDPRLTR